MTICSLFKVLFYRYFKLWYFANEQLTFLHVHVNINTVTSPTTIIQYITKSEIGIYEKNNPSLLLSACHWTPLMDSIYLTYPEPTGGKDKNRTASRRKTSDVIGTLNDVIVLYAASQRIQELLRALFSIKVPYLMVCKKKNPLFVWGWDRTILPSW